MIKELPDMFTSWKEYRDYLLEHLVRPDLQEHFRRNWRGQDDEEWYAEHCQEIMANDWTGTKNGNAARARDLARKVQDGTFGKRRREYIEKVMMEDENNGQDC